MAITDKFTYVGTPGSATYLASPGYTIGGTSQNLEAWAGWPTGAVHYDIYTVQLDGAKETAKSGSRTSWKAIHNGSGVLSSLQKKGGTDQNYPAGTNTRVIITHSAYRENEIIDGILAHANQDGTLITQAVRDALSLGANTSTGWEVGSLPNVGSVTANGNGSYNVTFASTVASILSEGMRLRTTRTTAAAITCFSLNGTNQYFNKTTPAGMTFTNNFVASAWVYLTSYLSDAPVISRINGTQGWWFGINQSGQIVLSGHNAALANYNRVVSYQSIPLNKWVHIAAELDMSSATIGATNSYVMINGKDVPAQKLTNGTNPSSLVQAGNLEIGSYNGGTNLFPGYIKDACIYGNKVTQANILARMHQTPLGTETDLISAYSGAGLTDLSANANNLTAQNSATSGYASAPYGNRGVSTTLDYGLVMAVSGSSVTVQVPEGCTIPTSGGVSAVAYSVMASPYGFVTDKGRWTVLSLDKTDRTQVASGTTWYNLGSFSISVPKGSWSLSSDATVYRDSGGYIKTTISTANNSEINTLNSAYFETSDAAGSGACSITRTINLTLDSATAFYLNIQSNTGTPNMYIFGGRTTTSLRALPAGL